jgi:hypothetical protein
MADRRVFGALGDETGVGLGRAKMEQQMSPVDLIAATGTAMFGGQYKAGLARALGVTDRTINRWLGGSIEPRPGVFADLLELMKARRAELDELIAATEAYLAQANEPSRSAR